VPYLDCDVCGADAPSLYLRSARLDGPLVRCRSCGHLYVGRRQRDFTFADSDPARSRALAEQVDALGIVDRQVEAHEDPGLRRAVQLGRLERLLGYLGGHGPVPATLLDVGAALGDFLAVAGERFDAEGIEADDATARQARDRGIRVRTGALETLPAPPGGYGALTMYHLIEHLASPRAGLLAARRLIADGGLLVIETPTVDSAFFALAPGRWRQLIPDHYHFFSEETLGRLLAETGFRAVASQKVGRRVSVRFAVDRWRRAGLPLAGLLARAAEAAGVAERSVHIVPGDIMEVAAVAGP
jgi:SAM-dependent methyltransferase